MRQILCWETSSTPITISPTYKNVMGLLWATEYCSEAGVIVKTDDDMWLDLHAISTISRAFNFNGELLACTVLNNLKVERTGKWAVS